MRVLSVAFLCSIIFLAGCSDQRQGQTDTSISETLSAQGGAVEDPLSKTSLPEHIFGGKPQGYPQVMAITIHKTPNCVDLWLWSEHLRGNNFEISVMDHEDLSEIRDRLGVPEHVKSCHTAEINGLFVQGYVPAVDIRRVLDVAPHAAAQIKGIAILGFEYGSVDDEDDSNSYRIVIFDEFDELDFGQYSKTNTPKT